MRVITDNPQALKCLSENCRMWTNSKRNLLRLDNLNNDLNLLGFNITRNYRGTSWKGYAIANHNQLDEFDQPTISYADTLAGCISKIGEWVKQNLPTEETKESYLSDPTNYPKLGNIPNVHNRYCFYQELHKLERLAEDKGLDVTNWFDGDFNWDNYPNDPDIAIVVWGQKSTNVYSREDKKWYSNITFEPSDQGLKRLAEFIKNYNSNLFYSYCEDCAHDCEMTDTECWNCGSKNIKSGTVKYNDRSVFFYRINDGDYCWECFRKQSNLNLMSDAIANIWDDQLECDTCNRQIESIVARNHANK